MPRTKRKATTAEAPRFNPIDHWSGCTHGKVIFATREEAEAYAEHICDRIGRVELGWYWSAGQVMADRDGRWAVVVP